MRTRSCMSDHDKTKTMAGLGALPPGKRMVLVEHTYNKQYTDYFYTIVVDDDAKLPTADQQVESQMDDGALESFDSDDMGSEHTETKTETIEFDVSDTDMTDAVSRWVEWQNKEDQQ